MWVSHLTLLFLAHLDPGVFGASRHLHALESAFASHSFGVHNLKTFVKSLLESWMIAPKLLFIR